MEGSREQSQFDDTPEAKFSGSHHFDSLQEAAVVEAEILRSYESGKNLSLSYNQGGVLCELELLTINTFPTELDAGRLYDFMVADGHNQGYKVVTVLIPRSRGKAVISVPW